MTIGNFKRMLHKLDIPFKLAQTGLETDKDDERLIMILFRIFAPDPSHRTMILSDFISAMLSGLKINIRRHVRHVRQNRKSEGYNIIVSK
jgi:hypothetical protein